MIERDPVLLLLAANAAYRDASRDESGPTAVQRLEVVLAQYADVLKRGSWQYDAAYNYEYLVQLRDDVDKGRRKADQLKEDASNVLGQPGATPASKSDMQNFKVIVPLAAGGTGDTLARVVSEEMAKKFATEPNV